MASHGVLGRGDADRVVGHARAKADHRSRHVTGHAGAGRAAGGVPSVAVPAAAIGAWHDEQIALFVRARDGLRSMSGS